MASNYVIVVLVIIVIIESTFIIWFIRNYKKEKNIRETIDFFRSLWGKFTFYVLATSIIGLFLGSIYFKEEIELNTINSWVSIVLGLVALIIGIISLFLSFYNLDETNKTNNNSLKIMQELQTKLTEQMNSMSQDIKHKIDESDEKTKDILRNSAYNNSSLKNSFEQFQGVNKWEDYK